MKLFIFGLGYTALRFVEVYGDRFDSIAGTVRSKDKRDLLQNGTWDVLVFNQEHVDPTINARVAQSDRVLVSIPAASGVDPVLSAFPTLLSSEPPDRIVYLSTIGVYADHSGGWIDERAPLIESSDRRAARICAERAWMATASARLRILRLAGIYGPGRNALQRLRDGTARRIVKPGQVSNRIHVDDAARAVAAAFNHDDSGTWNVCDDEPAPPQDVIAFAAGLMGVRSPPDEDFDQASMTAMARSFYATNNRVQNTKLKSELGVTLAYPTYRDGLEALML